MPCFSIVSNTKLGQFFGIIRMAFEEITPQLHNPFNHRRSMSKESRDNITFSRFLDFSKAFHSIHRWKDGANTTCIWSSQRNTAKMMLYKNTKAIVRSLDRDTFFDIFAGVIQGHRLAPYSFIRGFDYIVQASLDLIK